MGVQMVTVPARVLKAPALKFQTSISPSKGSWNLKDQKFNRASKMRGKFSAFQIQIVDQDLKTKNFTACFNKLCEQLARYKIGNVTMPPPGPLVLEDLGNWNTIENRLNDRFAAAYKKGIRWLWIAIPEKNAYLYSVIKKLGDFKYGIHTVVIQDENVERIDPNNNRGSDLGLVGNECLKFCAKSGGLSWAIDPSGLKLIGSETMVIGIDVTHPSPASQANAPSIAAIVSSYDGQLSSWAADLRTQTSRVEMVEGLTEMMKGRLQLFEKKNDGRLPSKIIVYRDGVSEGQFKTVLNIEYPAMVKAFEGLYGNREKHPKVSIIVSTLFPYCYC
jgi:eukaryotic translation initiation factor 2C